MGNSTERPSRRRRVVRIALIALIVLLVGGVVFVAAGGREAVARAVLRHYLIGRVDTPDLDASLGRIDLRAGRLWEEGYPDHVLISVAEGHAEVDILRLDVPLIVLRGGILDYRERIAGFVRRTGADFPRLELYDTAVRLRGETVLTAVEAVLERNEEREYHFRGRDLRHRGVHIDAIELRLSEHGGGVDVPAAVARLPGGGEVRATLAVGSGGVFHGRLRGERLDLQALSLLLGSPTRTRFEGNLEAEVEVTGSPYEPGAFRAHGVIRGSDLVIRDEPLLLDVIALLHGVRPDETPFTEGTVRFQVAGSEIRILEAEVLGPRWGLRGEGVVDPRKGTVDVEVVLVSRGSRLADFPVVGGRLQAVSDALRERVARAHIRGTFDRPVVVATALEELGEAAVAFVRRLLAR